MLRKQTEDLLAGNFVQFAAVAAQDDAVAGRDLRRRFDNLRALKVTRFDQQAQGPLDAGPGRWRVADAVSFCFVETDCAPDRAVFDTLWKETPQGLRFTGFARHDPKGCSTCLGDTANFVRPWETTDLAVQVGVRTLVAVTAPYRGMLPELTKRADAAAALADKYAIGDGPVDRYRVFVADQAAWRLWYIGFPGRWVAGQALPTGANGVEVEVLLSELTPNYTDELLRHELAHVATLRSNTYYGHHELWWLVEGMADYVQQRAGAGPYFKRAALRGFLRRRTMRTVRVTPPAPSASATDAAARYAVGYYALTYLVAKYGKAKTLQFFQQAVQYGLGLDTASRGAFGKPWSQIDTECVAAVRKA